MTKINDDLIDYIKNSKCYIKNNRITKCSKYFNDNRTLLICLMDVTYHSIKINNMKYNDVVIKKEIELEKYKIELSNLNDIIDFLSTFNIDKRIQDCF